jgi:hypothetical protein
MVNWFQRLRWKIYSTNSVSVLTGVVLSFIGIARLLNLLHVAVICGFVTIPLSRAPHFVNRPHLPLFANQTRGKALKSRKGESLIRKEE